jgi:hypothetical protein
MIDFPSNPSVGQTFTAAGVTWIWDGVKWLPSGLSPTVVPGINDNRIINGDMRIDQRNNGVGTTPVAGTYCIDRWKYSSTQAGKFTSQNAPGGALLSAAGFGYYLGLGSTSAYIPLASDFFQINQPIEADFVADFAFGTANAQPITLSFLVYSSLTGAFGGSITNAGATRSYPFTYQIPTANTWTKIAVTIPGDTAGTWTLQGNAAGIVVHFDLGSGATFRGPAGAWASVNYCGATGTANVVAVNGASFNLTGVKLEIGSVATPFNRQSLAKTLVDCQRYYQIGGWGLGGYGSTTGTVYSYTPFQVAMRASPTLGYSVNSIVNITSGAPTPGSQYGFVTNVVVTANGAFLINGTIAADAEL